MFLCLLSKEIRRHVMTFRFAAALLTTFTLVVISVWVLANDYILRRDTYNVVAEQTAESYQQVYVPSQISPTLHRPPSVLSIFAEGEERRLGDSVRIQRNVVPYEATGSFTNNPMMAALPPFDLLTIFAIVISLFGLLITYDGISGEREDGTLKLISNSSVRRGSLYAAKFLAGIVCIATPFLVSFACCLILPIFWFNLRLTAGQWLAIVVMVIAALIYASLFVGLGLLTSVLVRRSSTSLVLALLIWALGVLVIPGAAQSASQMFVPPPSPVEVSRLEQEIRREFRAELTELYRKYRGCWSGWVSGYNPDGGFWMFDGGYDNFRLSAEMLQEAEPINLSNARRVWDVRRRHDLQRQLQAELADLFASIAPVHQLRRAFTLLAGTDIDSYESFLRIARRYRERLLDDFRERGYFGENALRFFSRRPLEEITDELWTKRREEYHRLARLDPVRYRREVNIQSWGPLPSGHIPPFSYSGAGPDFIGASSPIAFLALGVAVVFSLGVAAFIRYDVR